ncbi:MAG: CsgG/HfaB family protein, partial [Kiritimatiellia bacterium]
SLVHRRRSFLPRPWRWAVPAFFLPLALMLTCIPAGGVETTVAVLNFANTHAGAEKDQQRWLSKGLADLLIGDLSLSKQLRVVTREDMQVLMQEAELIDKAIGPNGIPDDSAAKLKQYLKVDQLIFGSYTVDGKKAVLRAQVIEQKSGKVLAEFSQEGELQNVLELEKALANKMLSYFEIGEPQSTPRVLPRWTDSVSAAQHLYEGIDRFDHGEFTLAWQAFLLALRADPNYADARYWLARMFYYRQEYDHAAIEYKTFVHNFPKHGRVGDAIMEFVHSHECSSDDPDKLRELYRSLQAIDWQDVRVHNQISYVSTSPLADWVLKREQQVLLFQGQYTEAFDLLNREMDAAEKKQASRIDWRKKDARRLDPGDWRTESIRLMAGLAELDADLRDIRLASDYLPYVDLELPADKPSLSEDLRGAGLKGAIYEWGTNYRILAPTGYCIRAVTARIKRTNDPDKSTCCRLQIRRYRYVDINTCWTEDTNPAKTNYVFKIDMPPGCTWFYMRPEYDGLSGAFTSANKPKVIASFDGWAIDAELIPLAANIGRLDVRVRNSINHRSLVDGAYVRSFNGVIANLNPGPHTLRIENMFGNVDGVEPLVTNVNVQAGTTLRLDLAMKLSEKARAAGWQNPACIANDYPLFKLRPQRPSNWRNGRPSICIDRRSGRKIAVWSHLDDMWMATSEDGEKWSGPVNLSPPVNSAHVELQPRLIQDEQGRYCLLFLSDRGIQRSLAGYVGWSKDLRQWSRPVMISAETMNDQDFMQTADGKYVFIGVRGDRSRPLADSIGIRLSRDLIDWSEAVELPGLGSPEALCLRQDRKGVFHLVAVKNEIMHLTSSNLRDWTLQHVIPRPPARYGGAVGMTATDDGIIVAVGSKDEQYGAAEVVYLVWLPLLDDDTHWRVLTPPRGVVDGMCDIIFDPKSDQIILAWQVTNMGLNTVLPAGPVFGMKANPDVWRPLRKEGGHE